MFSASDFDCYAFKVLSHFVNPVNVGHTAVNRGQLWVERIAVAGGFLTLRYEWIRVICSQLAAGSREATILAVMI